MRRSLVWGPVTAVVLCTLLLVLPRLAAADVARVQNPHFPEPVALTPNVAFWKQVYTEHGVGDFVLHDRDNLGVIYDVVRVPEKASQARAEQLAKPEIERVRGRYRDILIQLAAGISPDDLGAEGRRLAALWECPCGPDSLRRAAENIRVQQGLREKVDEGLQRAQKLLPKIVTILKRHDVPPELAALPLVESTFNPAAKSKAGAVGLWQFIKPTGKRYLTITRKRDDRRDPLRATEAAAHHLKNSYTALGSWPLAIVAYNHGHAGIRAASTMVGSTAIEDIVARYNGPRFGFASKNFYAEFLAALDVFHPLLAGHGIPLGAKNRQRSVQQAALPAQRPPAPLPVPLAPPAAPAPVEAETAIPPAVPAAESEPPIEASGPPEDPPGPDQSVNVEEIAAVAAIPVPADVALSDSPDTLSPIAVDPSPYETAPPETPDVEPSDPVSP